MRPKKYRYFIRKYFKAFKYLLFFFFIGMIAYYLFDQVASGEYFKIKTYTYSGIVKFVNKNDFEKVLEENIKDKTYFSLKSKNLQDTLTTNFLALKNIKVVKKPFNKIEVHTQERVPVAVITDMQTERFLIDAEGYVLGVIDDSYMSLPDVTYPHKLFVGTFIDKNIVPIALEILNASKVEQVSVSSISFEPEYSTFSTGRVRVYIGNNKNIGESVKIVSRILLDSANNTQRITKIDLRYDKVIVSYD